MPRLSPFDVLKAQIEDLKQQLHHRPTVEQLEEQRVAVQTLEEALEAANERIQDLENDAERAQAEHASALRAASASGSATAVVAEALEEEVDELRAKLKEVDANRSGGEVRLEQQLKAVRAQLDEAQTAARAARDRAGKAEADASAALAKLRAELVNAQDEAGAQSRHGRGCGRRRAARTPRSTERAVGVCSSRACRRTRASLIRCCSKRGACTNHAAPT